MNNIANTILFANFISKDKDNNEEQIPMRRARQKFIKRDLKNMSDERCKLEYRFTYDEVFFSFWQFAYCYYHRCFRQGSQSETGEDYFRLLAFLSSFLSICRKYNINKKEVSKQRFIQEQ
jgi:hypothetical protein